MPYSTPWLSPTTASPPAGHRWLDQVLASLELPTASGGHAQHQAQPSPQRPGRQHAASRHLQQQQQSSQMDRQQQGQSSQTWSWQGAGQSPGGCGLGLGPSELLDLLWAVVAVGRLPQTPPPPPSPPPSAPPHHQQPLPSASEAAVGLASEGGASSEAAAGGQQGPAPSSKGTGEVGGAGAPHSVHGSSHVPGESGRRCL